jgi:hypothetical protein
MTGRLEDWIPAFAGMTGKGGNDRKRLRMTEGDCEVRFGRR